MDERRQTKASVDPAQVDWYEFTVGKSVDAVPPTTQAVPSVAAAILKAISLLSPPKYVE